MSEPECRHLPRPVWNPARCAKCGATLEQPVNARLLAVLAACRSRFATLESVARQSPRGVDPAYCMASYEMLVMIDAAIAEPAPDTFA